MEQTWNGSDWTGQTCVTINATSDMQGHNNLFFELNTRENIKECPYKTVELLTKSVEYDYRSVYYILYNCMKSMLI